MANKPPAAGIGRKKGVLNKFTGTIKDMVEQALNNAGGVAYLTKQADDNPVAFMGLVGKLLPKNVDVQVTHSLEDLVLASMKPPAQDDDHVH